MKTKYYLLTFAILFVALIFGCSNDDFESIPGVCPIVIATDPDDGAISVPLEQTITVLFNEEMDPATFTRSSLLVKGAGTDLISGEVTLSGALASFTPTNPLLANTTYTGTVTTAVKDKKGNALQEDYIFTFSTGVTLIPMVTSTDPLNLSTDVFLNKTVTANFNMLMDPLTINATTFTLKRGTTAVAGEVTYLGQSAYFNPTNNLESGTEYTATITTGAENTFGTPIATNYIWKFTTGTLIAPTVISTDPISDASGVSLDKTISAVFSVAMNPTTINTTTFTLMQGTTAIAGAVTYSGQIAYFNPTDDLVYGKVYTATITTGAENVAGTPLVGNYVWKFTAGATVAPKVISTDPNDNATGVVLDKTLAAVFSVAMDPSTINTSTFTLKNGTTPVTGVVTYSGQIAYFNPTTDLIGGTLYTATITNAVKDIQGTPMVSNYTWKFTTGTTIAPRVVSTDPANNETGVALNKTASAVFSVAMDPSTINTTTFTLKLGTTVIPGVVTYSDQSAYFNPTSNLLDGTEYTATITTGAKDVQGTALEANYTWKFNTGTTVAPRVISTDPINNANGIALDKIVSAVFSLTMDPATINTTTFTLKRGTVAVTGAVTYSDQTAYFNPTDNLLNGTEYTATITTGVQDTNGTPMVNNYTWKFTTGSTIAPRVVSTDPIANATGVALDKIVLAVFSVVMDPTTINANTFTLKQGGTTIPGVVTYSDQSAFFNPTNNLVSGLEYTATITTGAKNTDGTPMVNDYTWKFTTRTNIAPTVISTDPLANATGIPVNKIVSAVFSVVMDPTTINTSTFTLKQGTTTIPGAVTYSGQTAYFNPTNNLAGGIEYTATITTGVKNTEGTAMASNYTWKFTTAAGAAPTVVSTDPSNNETGVVLNKTLTALFSMNMDPTTINSNSFTLKRGTTAIAGAVTYSGQTASFNPNDNLLNGIEYTATITTEVKNTNGVSMASNYTWKFTTVAGIAPTVISTDPINNAIGVPINKTVTALFSMNMDPTTINTGTFTLKRGTTSVTGAVTYSGQTASFNPTNNLLNGIEYTATITNGVKNTNGVAMASNYTWKFTTVAGVAPTVIATDPMNNATGIALNKNVTADFSTQMNPTTINNNSFTLKRGATVVPGSLSYSGVRLSFNPTSPLLENTTYTATITTEAESTAGVPLANNYVWTFKTLTSPNPGIDLGSVARFGIFAAVGVSNNAGFSEIRNLDVGISPGLRSSVSGFPPAVIINGAIYAADDPNPVPAMLIQAKADLTAAYLAAAGASTPAPVTVSGDQGGLTLAPGIYKSNSTLLIQNGDLTLDAQGDPNATWIFQVASSFTTIGGAGGNIILAGGAKAKNIIWQVGSSATVGDYTIFKGNILALTSISMNSHAVAEGRMLCINGAIVMTDTNVIAKPAN